MTVALTMPQQDNANYDYRYRHKETLSSAGYTAPILIFNILHDVNCGVYPVSGNARFEYTISSASEVVDETAVWFIWPAGDVDSNTVDSMFSNATAIRGYTSGEATFEMSGV